MHRLVIGAAPVEAGLPGVSSLELDAIDDGLALVPAGAALVFTVRSGPEHAAFAVHRAIAQHLAFAGRHEHERAVCQRVSAGKAGVWSFRSRLDVERDADDDSERRKSEEEFSSSSAVGRE
jgi:hypothetical protein